MQTGGFSAKSLQLQQQLLLRLRLLIVFFFVQLAYFLLITPGKARYFKEEPLKIAG